METIKISYITDKYTTTIVAHFGGKVNEKAAKFKGF